MNSWQAPGPGDYCLFPPTPAAPSKNTPNFFSGSPFNMDQHQFKQLDSPLSQSLDWTLTSEESPSPSSNTLPKYRKTSPPDPDDLITSGWIDNTTIPDIKIEEDFFQINFDVLNSIPNLEYQSLSLLYPLRQRILKTLQKLTQACRSHTDPTHPYFPCLLCKRRTKDGMRQIIFYPCGHQVTCLQCHELVSVCPYSPCKSPIIDRCQVPDVPLDIILKNEYGESYNVYGGNNED